MQMPSFYAQMNIASTVITLATHVYCVQDEAQVRDTIQKNCSSAVAVLITIEALRVMDSGAHRAKADALKVWLQAGLPADDFNLAATWTLNRASVFF